MSDTQMLALVGIGLILFPAYVYVLVRFGAEAWFKVKARYWHNAIRET